MESGDLRVFRAVAQEGSITKAAHKLGYVQSNVTARIQQLEAELKTPLFYRQHGMILTPDGEKLLPHAIKILQLLNEAEKELTDSNTPTGRLSIGTSYYISSLKLPEMLSQYHKEYPNVDLSLITSNVDDLIYKILQFKLDGAFVKGRSIHHENIAEELVYEENLVLIANPAYSELKTICCKPFLMNTAGCPNRKSLEKWLQAEGICNIRYMEFNNLDSIIEGVVADLGASFVPHSSIRTYEEKGLLKSFPVPPQYSTAKIFFIRHKETVMTSALVKFIEKVKDMTSRVANA
ncbi:transcriptional regulator [Desulfosporosinus acidiphilus SJ4]|uniref:Transcriptional regulator n=1 Tax=Desulfosporosinus acidiphilus (strain DSM 22704 / JCM 16185 / SJ4) TaxID=646529 RepID=I4D1H1_DESAJ|nr:LysR family transcriptional regulator [Desulfosporosinus acidiphilus]AFM39645.1 transcriptional regulator [Desulfosporosinus acidiphilus SJ4]